MSYNLIYTIHVQKQRFWKHYSSKLYVVGSLLFVRGGSEAVIKYKTQTALGRRPSQVNDHGPPCPIESIQIFRNCQSRKNIVESFAKRKLDLIEVIRRRFANLREEGKRRKRPQHRWDAVVLDAGDLRTLNPYKTITG